MRRTGSTTLAGTVTGVVVVEEKRSRCKMAVSGSTDDGCA